jgi:hypothetical protein
MKTLLLAGLIFSSGLYAAPIVNKNIATKGSKVTIWPDHLDSNQFYYAPKSLKLAKDENGKVMFNAFEYKMPGCGLLKQCRLMYMNSFFEVDFAEKDLNDQIAAIMQSQPKAKFSPIAYMESVVIFSNLLKPFIADHNCASRGGQAMDLVPCGLILNKKGIEKIAMMLSEGLPVTFNFNYTISGVVEGENPRYRNEERIYSVGVNMGGEDLIHHPDLDQ